MHQKHRFTRASILVLAVSVFPAGAAADTGPTSSDVAARSGVAQISGTDRLYSGPGDDMIAAHPLQAAQPPEPSEVFCEGLAATQVGTDGPETITGTEGPDVIAGLGGRDIIFGLGGDDVICGGGGNDRIIGGPGSDFLVGGLGRDALLGQTGDDVLNGQGGDDMLNGGLGADRLNGRTGDDTLYGWAGADRLWGDDGDDTIYGHDGRDRIDAGAGRDVIYGGRDADTIEGRTGGDRIYGESGSDLIYGGLGVDRVRGGLGDDRLHGGGGNDVMYGQAGNDLVNGQDGSDILNGGIGRDRCSWDTTTNCEKTLATITTVDSEGTVGRHTSLALNAAGFPVISYLDYWPGDLMMVVCNDPACAGGDETITTVDSDGEVGWYTSLALDASGNPVISYYDNWHGDLKVVACNDPVCAGGDDWSNRVDGADATGIVGKYSSLVLNASGYPVISYYDSVNEDLKVAACNDPACAGRDETITTVDADGDVGMHTSLALNASGNPVISYHDYGQGDLKVVACNDPACAGGDETITTVDSEHWVGEYTSLALNAAGHPVISYRDRWTGLKVVACNDAACAGGDETITTVDHGDVGEYTSLALNAAGHPVIAYAAHYDPYYNCDLRVVACNDPACAGGDETITTVDATADVGTDTSIALDASGNPVIAYYDSSGRDLKVIRLI